MSYGVISLIKLKNLKEKVKCHEITWIKRFSHFTKWTQHSIKICQPVSNINRNMMIYNQNIRNWLLYSDSKLKALSKKIHQSKALRVYKSW